MRDVTLVGLSLVTLLSTMWIVVYGFFVTWYRNIYGQMLMLLMFSLWVSLIATLHDLVAGPGMDWGPDIGVPITAIMSAAIGASLVVMIRDNFFRKEKDDVEQSCETCAVPESDRRCAGCIGDVGVRGER